MGKVNNRDIYEIKPWLNDDKQNVDGLTALVGGGGGGSSDFSTAEVTLHASNTPFVITIPLIQDNDALVVAPLPVIPAEDVVITVPLYNGVLILGGITEDYYLDGMVRKEGDLLTIGGDAYISNQIVT